MIGKIIKGTLVFVGFLGAIYWGYNAGVSSEKDRQRTAVLIKENEALKEQLNLKKEG